mmetsp:Transcript_5412/g.8895  ORF Transcript_5412/g.8895 Transcript_5412/m.8895 type:complete len:380 (+) Transcript_5412:106-1245(+)
MSIFGTEDERVLEQKHFHCIVAAYDSYEEYTMRWIDKLDKNWMSLPESHRALIPGWKDRISRMREAAKANHSYIKLITEPHQLFENDSLSTISKETGVHSHSNGGSPSHNNKSSRKTHVSENDMDKVRSTLRQFVRDWSAEGAEERSQSYTPLIEEITKHFPPGTFKRNEISVLVPGAGLARLALEICRHGYQVQGNEWSYFMLLGSQFILNRSEGSESYTIYPWLHSTSNVVNTDDFLRPVSVPDMDPSVLPPNSDFSMIAGDFIEIYSKQIGQWDCVCTCFFIDTAHNIIQYLKVIAGCLKPGGIWVNLGPLLYHYADIGNELSIELSFEEIRKVASQLGLNIIKEEWKQCTYTCNQRSMMRVVYNCVLFVAVKTAS